MSAGAGGRPAAIGRALALEYWSVVWNVVEGAVALRAALASRSVALLGFGIDSLIELASGGILIWRLKAESRLASPEEVERLDRKAHGLVALTLFALAGYIAVDAVRALWLREAPRPSAAGLAVTAAALVVMGRLSRAKRAAAGALDSRAMLADAFQTGVCMRLSAITLAGVGLNAAWGWWWADPAAALSMAYFIFEEGRRAWRGEACC